MPAHLSGWIGSPRQSSKTSTGEACLPRQASIANSNFVAQESSFLKYDRFNKNSSSQNIQSSVGKRRARRTTTKNVMSYNISDALPEDGYSSDHVSEAEIGHNNTFSASEINSESNAFYPDTRRQLKLKPVAEQLCLRSEGKKKKQDNEIFRDGAYLDQDTFTKSKETVESGFNSEQATAVLPNEHDEVEDKKLDMENIVKSTFPTSPKRTFKHSKHDLNNLAETASSTACRVELTACQADASPSDNHFGNDVDAFLATDEEKMSTKEVSYQLSDRTKTDAKHGQPSMTDVRRRWRRLKNTVTVVNRMAASRSSNYDLFAEEPIEGVRKNQMYVRGDGGSMGAAAFEGVRTTAQRRKGRKGMEGLLVRQDKGFITFIQDFYVTCLKIPIIYFLIGVFLVPVALGLVFTPLYLLDVNGLSFDGVINEQYSGSLFTYTKQRFSAILNIFLYALSLSTTFGGSPVAAVSPYCLLVANLNTLLAQFLFVFLSGAVFARMSQPSQPIRCAKKAIIKVDDVTTNTEEAGDEKLRVLAIRLVLGGPTPCELVDAKICLTCRIFVALPNGTTFCSTQDLELVRSEVSYLRYGLMVRHIIDKKSPLYGHTMETLDEGDASFSLTVMGLERSSMQSIFHLEDYFVSDGDVVWDGDYADFIHINEKGQRVLDHSKIDLLKPKRDACSGLL